MTRRRKILVFAVSLALLAIGSALLAIAHRTQPSVTGQPLEWPLVLAILLNLLGLAGLIGAMAVLIAALLPHALNAPDADELSRDNPPPLTPPQE